MARWISFCCLLFVFLFAHVATMTVTGRHRVPYNKRHIGAAREKLFRARPVSSHADNLFQRPKQALPSPEVLRARWLGLFNDRNRVREALIFED